MSGRDRKNSLKALFGGEITPEPARPEIPAQAPGQTPGKSSVPGGFGEAPQAGFTAGPGRAPETKAMTPEMLAQAGVPRTASGAVKAMGMSLSSITREAEEGRALREALARGERIVALDPDKIESSFVSDRLSDAGRDDPDFAALVASIAENGQQVPILVRPMPDALDRYQVAYGHRRLKAARELGQPVQAIVRALSDEALVLAQGQENAERRNLSFIERALFAAALVTAGFDRRIVGEALSVQKSELSRLLQVAETMPEHVARAIGPAPKAGRERWMALASIYAGDKGGAMAKSFDEMSSPLFKAADSDQRFQRLYDRLSQTGQRERTPAESRTVSAPDGAAIATVETRGRGVRISFTAAADPAFVDSITGRLEAAYAEFLSTAEKS